MLICVKQTYTHIKTNILQRYVLFNFLAGYFKVLNFAVYVQQLFV